MILLLERGYNAMEWKDKRRNDDSNDIITALYNQGYNGYRIHQLLTSQGVSIAKTTVYAKIKQLKESNV